MFPKGLVTISQAAEFLETDRLTVGGLIRALNLKTYPMPLNGSAKGLDTHALTRLAIALGRSKRATCQRARKSAISGGTVKATSVSANGMTSTRLASVAFGFSAVPNLILRR